MNILQKILFGASCLLLLASCAKEEQLVTDGQDVLITLATGTRAGEEAGDLEDREMNSLRILGYRSSDGQLTFNEEIAIPSGSESYNGTVTMKTGKYTVVIIANEGTLSTTLGDDALISTIGDLRSLYFEIGAFNETDAIPMVTVKEDIVIQGDDLLIDAGTTYTTEWPVEMERLGIRVDVTLNLSDIQREDWQIDNGKIYFGNIPDKVYLFPGIANAPGTSTRSYTMLDYTDDSKTQFTSPRIILPEVYAAGLSQSGALTLSVLAPTELKSAISADNGASYILSRNTRLGLTATIGETSLTFVVNVIDWEDENMNHVLQ